MAVLVPTYRRTQDLARCLNALEMQTRAADRVIVVYHARDAESERYLAARRTTLRLPLEVVAVTAPGQVAALNAGLAGVGEGVVCITDDDAAPRPDWLARLERHFDAAGDIGAVGGRDHIRGVAAERESARVGRLEWFGRAVGNHHCGIGPAREVEVLKGANMSYRIEAIRSLAFDSRLRGDGAQRHNDLAFSLAVRKRGWKLVYDPEVAVDHFPGERASGIERSERSLRAISEGAFNETLAVLDYLPPLARPFFWSWSVLVGSRDVPGLVRCLPSSRRNARLWRLFLPMLKARCEAAAVAAARRQVRAFGAKA